MHQTNTKSHLQIDNKILAAALSYIQLGWPVIPVHRTDLSGRCSCGSRECNSPGKHPKGMGWQKRATTDQNQVETWFAAGLQNIGIVCGKEAGLWVLDVDGDAGRATLKRLEEQHGGLPSTVTAVTPGGGLHLFFQYPESRTVGNSVRVLPGLDTRSDAGQVVAAPSQHPNGGFYHWKERRSPAEIQIAEAPQWLLDIITKPANSRGISNGGIPGECLSEHALLYERATAYVHKAKPSAKGNRNRSAFNLAGHLLAFQMESDLRLTESEIVNLMRTWNDRNNPPLSDAELQSTIKSAGNNGTARDRHIVSTNAKRLKGGSPTTDASADELDTPLRVRNSIERHGEIRTIADEITSRERFAVDVAGSLFRYDAGKYQPNGDRFIKRAVKQICKQWGISSRWSPRLTRNVIEYVATDSPELWEQPPGQIVNVRNGLLDIMTGQLTDHSPDHLSVVQLPVEFDSAATCPEIKSFVATVFPNDSVELAWQIVGWVMAPEKSIQKAILLIGGGGNGKSTFIRMLLNFIGAENTVALSLHKLEADRFAVAKLLGKLANVCADLPTSHLQGTSVFKAITGGDRIAGEYKFKPVFEFESFCKLLFSANAPPMSSDFSAAFFDRWIVIPFERSFRGTSAEIPSEVLNEKLANPSELSGLLNLAIAARKTLNTTKALLEPESVRQARNRFQQATDSLAVFLDQHTQVDPQAVLPTVELRTAFNRSLTETGKPAMSDTGFGAHFQRITGGKFDKKQRTIDGTVKWCYVGLKLV